MHCVPRDTTVAGTWFPVLMWLVQSLVPVWVWLLEFAESHHRPRKTLLGCDTEPLSSEYTCQSGSCQGVPLPPSSDLNPEGAQLPPASACLRHMGTDTASGPCGRLPITGSRNVCIRCSPSAAVSLEGHPFLFPALFVLQMKELLPSGR